MHKLCAHCILEYTYVQVYQHIRSWHYTCLIAIVAQAKVNTGSTVLMASRLCSDWDNRIPFSFVLISVQETIFLSTFNVFCLVSPLVQVVKFHHQTVSQMARNLSQDVTNLKMGQFINVNKTCEKQVYGRSTLCWEDILQISLQSFLSRVIPSFSLSIAKWSAILRLSVNVGTVLSAQCNSHAPIWSRVRSSRISMTVCVAQVHSTSFLPVCGASWELALTLWRISFM